MTSPLRTAAALDDGPHITRAALAAYVVLALLSFAPAFLPGQQIAGSDYVTGGYYFLEFAVQRMSGGHLPKWVPYIFGGVPMYANPGGLFYPLRLLFSAILPIERVMPAVFVVQFALAGIGMHLFARVLGVRTWVAFVAGLMFQLTGVTFSYVFAGHDGRIIVATLTPLVFYFVTRAVREDRMVWFVGLAATVGFIMLSFQLQSTYYVLLSGGAWAVFLLARARGELAGRQITLRVAKGLAAVGFAFVLSAVNLLPFAGYVKDSPRSVAAGRDYNFSTQFSMPLVETVGFAVPEQAGLLEEYRGENAFKLHTEYVGALVLLLVVIGIAVARRDVVWRFMAGLAAFMLTVCYGSHTPLYALYYTLLPGTPKFRSPSIALFIVSFALVAMAALTLEALARVEGGGDHGTDRPARDARRAERLATAGVAFAVVALLVAGGTILDGGTKAIGWLRFGVCLLASALVVRAWLLGRFRLRTASILLALVTVADLWLIDHNFLWTQPPADMVYAEDAVVRFIRSQPQGRVWVFPFPETRGAPHYMGNGRFGPQSDYLMRFGIQQAGGEHGNQLYRWNRFAGIGSNGSVDWHNFLNYPQMLNASGVRYIISGVPLKMLAAGGSSGLASLREVYKDKGAFVYANERSVSRAYLVADARAIPNSERLVAEMRRADWDPHAVAFVDATASPLPHVSSADSVARPSAGVAQIAADDPDRVAVRLRATRPALLVLNDNYAEGWVARLDGAETPIVPTNLTFRGVAVPAGDHEVVFSFEPPRLYAGLWISAVAWALVVLAIVGSAVMALRGRGRRRNLVPAH